MSNKSSKTDLDCFPDVANATDLPVPVSLSEMQTDIQTARGETMTRLDTLFPRDVLVMMHAANSTKLTNVFEAMDRSLTERNQSHLYTYGELRRVRINIRRIIQNAQKDEPGTDGRHLHPELSAGIEQSFARISQKYADSVRLSAMEKKGTERMNKVIGGPSWIQGFTNDEVDAFLDILEISPDTELPHHLDEFLQLTKTTYAAGPDARRQLIKTIIHSLANANSTLNSWLTSVGRERPVRSVPSIEVGGAKNVSDVVGDSILPTIPAPETVAGAIDSIVTNSISQDPLADNSIVSDRILQDEPPVPEAERIADDSDDNDEEIIIGVEAGSAEGNVLQPLDEDALFALGSAAILRYMDGIAAEAAGDDAKIPVILQRLGIPAECFTFWNESKNDHATVVDILSRLDRREWFSKAEQKKYPAVVWAMIFTQIWQTVSDEVERGDSVFKQDELEVAYEAQLKDYKLLDLYQKSSGLKPVPAVAPTLHPSLVGFSEEEAALISREDRERINTMFASLPKEQPADILLSADHTSTLCEIARLLLMHVDTVREQLQGRLGLDESVLWAALKQHQLSLLGREELAALERLQEEIDTAVLLKGCSQEEFEDRKREMQTRIALYRRLIRLQHAEDAAQKMAIAANGLEMTDEEIARLEHKTYRGFSNYDLASDLFPSLAEQNRELDAESAELFKQTKSRRRVMPAVSRVGSATPGSDKPEQNEKREISMSSARVREPFVPREEVSLPSSSTSRNGPIMLLGALLGILSRTPPSKNE